MSDKKLTREEMVMMLEAVKRDIDNKRYAGEASEREREITIGYFNEIIAFITQMPVTKEAT